MNDLLLHCGSRKNTRYDLAQIATPEGTVSWKPVPHITIAELVTAGAEERGYRITREEYGLNPAGTKMFGVLRFHPEGHPEYSRALGFRNSHDKSMAVGLTAGLSVLVCDNMCFGGETVIHRKHTTGIEIEALVNHAFGHLEYQFIRLEENVEEMKRKHITVTSAKLITVKAAETGAINSSDIIPVLREFTEPAHEEFKPRTRWSLYNAFTETAKKYTPARADTCYRKLGQLFELNIQEAR